MNATVPQPDPTPQIHPVARGELEDGIVRPTGLLQPTHERAVRAFKALEDRRFKDAESNIDAIPESPPTLRTWKLMLKGLLMLEQSNFTSAKALLRQAAGCELLDHTDDESGHIEVVLSVQARHLGRLAADKRTADLTAGVGHPLQ